MSEEHGLAALLPQTYLDMAASPLGAALQPCPMVAIGVDDQGLDTVPLVGDRSGEGQTVRFLHQAGLEIGLAVEPDAGHQAVVWHLDFAQHGPAGPRLHDLRPLTLVLDGAEVPDPVICTWLDGAAQTFFPPTAVTPERHVVYPRTPSYYHATSFDIGTRGGRSSDRYMPYLLLTNQEDSGGLWCAIGWSGHWTAHFQKPKDSADLHLTVQIAPCDLRLQPGARLRGPSMALGLYRGDVASGCNALRRWLRAQMPDLPGDGDLSHFNTWTAMDADVDEARLLAAADQVAGVGLRSFMLDAGWYPAPRDNFSAGVGNWRVDPAKFPRGLEVVAERVRSNGMQMGLWIEPERACLTSELALQHPTWLLTASGAAHALVNFALPEVRAFFRACIGDLVRRLALRWLKWDFNMDPLPAWIAAGDGGLSHLGHVQGLWETLDWLRATFPDLVIENCASGGNRLDWTLFSRTHVNFANDQYTQPDCIRRILGRMAAFLPSERLNMIFGPYEQRAYGDAAWQVLQGSAFGVSEPLDNWTPDFVAGLRRNLATHRATATAQHGDFYRLTPDIPALRAWEAWQMHDPHTGSGVVALWRSEAPNAEITVYPRALDPSGMYLVSDIYGGSEETMTGDALTRGLSVSVPPTGAALRGYRLTGSRVTP